MYKFKEKLLLIEFLALLMVNKLARIKMIKISLDDTTLRNFMRKCLFELDFC